jgi:spermidine synthase
MDLWYSRNESPSTKWCVRVTRPLFSGEGKSGRVDVLETEDFGRALSVGGCLAFTEGEGFSQREMLVHAPLGVHPNARAAMVVGGRDCGTVAELLRYAQLERIVLVEEDAVVLEAQRRFFPEQASALSDPRVHVAQEDAEGFARGSKERFDVAIIQSQGNGGEAALGQSFYCDCFRLLSGDGILVSPAGSAYYAARRRELVSAAGKLKRLFPSYRLYSVESPAAEGGSRLLGFASKKYDPVKDYDGERWARRGLATRYYDADVHRAAFALPRYVAEALEGC